MSFPFLTKRCSRLVVSIRIISQKDRTHRAPKNWPGSSIDIHCRWTRYISQQLCKEITQIWFWNSDNTCGISPSVMDGLNRFPLCWVLYTHFYHHFNCSASGLHNHSGTVGRTMAVPPAGGKVADCAAGLLDTYVHLSSYIIYIYTHTYVYVYMHICI